MQNLSLRLNPDGSLFVGDDGQPSELRDRPRRSRRCAPRGASSSTRSSTRGGKYVWITNVDNLGASIDPAMLGQFIEAAERASTSSARSAERQGDKGGIPVHAEGQAAGPRGVPAPAGFDPTTVNVFNTNTFLVRAEPLAKQPLTWTYFEVEKKVDGRTAIQFERLIQEITAQMPSTYLEVPREGDESRFLPVKDFDELARRRDIERVPSPRMVARAETAA